MLVNVVRIPVSTYRHITGGYSNISSPNKSGLRLIDLGKSVASKAAYETALARALENKKFWDELLEKLRKSGGGGGSERIDKVKTSMMFMNYVSNKMIHAMLKNFSLELLGFLRTVNKLASLTINPSILHKTIGTVSVFISNLVLIVANLLQGLKVQSAVKLLSNFQSQFNLLACAMSAQINKLKETLFDELKELFRKFDIDDKLKKTIREFKNIFFPQLELAGRE